MDIKFNENYYKILDIDKKSDQDLIKKAYRNLSKIYHPDKNNGDDSKFKVIVEAYKVLSDESLKTEYDMKSKFGHNYDPTTELLNFEFANNNIVYDEYKKSKDDIKSEIIDIYIEIDGSSNIIDYKRLIACNNCELTGVDRDGAKDCNVCHGEGINNNGKDCYMCSGSGKLTLMDCDLCDNTGKYNNDNCPLCRGGGGIGSTICKKCAGKGRLLKNEKIKVNFSKFVDDKLKIEFKGNSSKTYIGRVGSVYIVKKDKKNE